MLASIKLIDSIIPHENADTLELAVIGNWKCIVKKDLFVPKEKVVFIEPDTVLPDKPWAAMYKAKSSRVKAIRLRGVWSEGIVEKLSALDLEKTVEGDVSEILDIRKYEPPLPNEVNIKGGLPLGMPKTDEDRWEKMEPMPYGQIVDITLKRDGKSWTGYAASQDDVWVTGICGRTQEHKLEYQNEFTLQDKKLGLLEKLLPFCQKHDVAIALRGELCGGKIQNSKVNPHAGGETNVALYSCYLINEHRYAGKGDPFYVFNVARALGFPTVEMIEENVELTPAIIKKYSEELTSLNGKPFEGVVVKGTNFSFKIINKDYDSKK